MNILILYEFSWMKKLEILINSILKSISVLQDSLKNFKRNLNISKRQIPLGINLLN